METKRKSDFEPGADGSQTDQHKRPRVAENGGSLPSSTVNLSIIEKAKAALQKQKDLKEKLERLKQAKSAVGPSRPAPTLPPPLVVMKTSIPPVSAPTLNPLLVPVEAPIEEAFGAHYDPSLGARGSRDRRVRASLRFVEDGKFQKEAEEMRLRAQLGDDYARQVAERHRREAEERAAAADGMDANLVPLGVRVFGSQAGIETKEAEEIIPDVEWWDARILVDRNSYGSVTSGDQAVLRLDRITHYVEHPPLIAPPAEAPLPPPQPLKLTKRELKKLRTQRRLAREAEKQDLIRQGLLEPPKPKVKISNLMRVLGAEAATDPTAIEAEVRRQMAERAAAHEDRNLARMLTPAERREKKLRKLLDVPVNGADGTPNGGATSVALYKVGDLSAPQLKFKVEVNAKENHMTGIALYVPGVFGVVIVEGGSKTLRRYEKLMLRRINWATPTTEAMDVDGNGDGEPNAVDAMNYCHLVWTGVVKAPAFKGKFKTEEARTEATARRLLEEKGVGHYWDLAEAYVPE